MVLLRHMQWARKHTGFTIVELLIVIVVIAILAAITIVAYNGIQNRAKNAAAQSAASQASKRIVTYAVENSDTFPADQTAFNALIPGGGAATYQYSVNNSVSPRTYCVTATVNNVSYSASSSNPAPTAGGCAGHGVNGAPVITNLIPNSSFETNTSGWGTSAASIARSNLNAASGSYSVEVTGTSTAGSGDIRLNGVTQTTMPIGLQAGKTYSISARVTYPVAVTGNFNRSPRILMWYSVDGTNWTENFGPKAPSEAGTYTVSHTFTLPANTTGVLLGLGVASTVVDQKFYYDAIMLTEGSTQYQYADGAASGWIWNGTPYGSTSYGSALQ